MDDFLKLVFSEDKKGHIHLDLKFLNRDEENDSYFITRQQRDITIKYLEDVKNHLLKGSLNDLK